MTGNSLDNVVFVNNVAQPIATMIDSNGNILWLKAYYTSPSVFQYSSNCKCSLTTNEAVMILSDGDYSEFGILKISTVNGNLIAYKSIQKLLADTTCDEKNLALDTAGDIYFTS